MNSKSILTRLSTVTSAGLVAMTLVGPTTAAPVGEAQALLRSALDGDHGQVALAINADGVATLSGYVESHDRRHAAELALLRSEEVNRVINLIVDD